MTSDNSDRERDAETAAAEVVAERFGPFDIRLSSKANPEQSDLLQYTGIGFRVTATPQILDTTFGLFLGAPQEITLSVASLSIGPGEERWESRFGDDNFFVVAESEVLPAPLSNIAFVPRAFFVESEAWHSKLRPPEPANDESLFTDPPWAEGSLAHLPPDISSSGRHSVQLHVGLDDATFGAIVGAVTSKDIASVVLSCSLGAFTSTPSWSAPKDCFLLTADRRRVAINNCTLRRRLSPG